MHFFRFSFIFRFYHVEVTLLQYIAWLIIIILIFTQCHHKYKQHCHSQSLTIVTNSVQSTGSSQFCSVQFSWINSDVFQFQSQENTPFKPSGHPVALARRQIPIDIEHTFRVRLWCCNIEVATWVDACRSYWTPACVFDECNAACRKLRHSVC